MIRRRRIIGSTLALAGLATLAVPASSALARTAGGESAGVIDDLPQGDEPVDLDPSDFTLDIDNPYYPLVPGTRRTFRETNPDGEEVTIEMTVTTRVKKLPRGFKAREVRDTVSIDGEIVEDTRDWYAQDEDGNV